MSFELDAVLGFADDITTNPNATVPLWSDVDANNEPRTGQRPAGAVGIHLDVWPESDDAVTITDYSISDDPSLSESVIGIQVAVWCHDRVRLRRIIADVFDRMHGRWGGNMGNVRLVTMTRRSGANLGQDGNGRVGRSENYYIQAHRPSQYRQ